MDKQFLLSSSTAFLEIFLFGGVIFGFPSLQYVLEQEGYFQHLCNHSFMQEPIIAEQMKNFTHKTCAEQEASFNLAFTLGTSLMHIACILWGYLLDRFGTWIFRSVLSFSFTLSYILLTVSTPKSAYLLYPVSILFGTAGFGVMMSNYQIANLSKTIRGSLMTGMNGMFSVAIAVFLIVKKSYDSGIQIQLIFLVMTCLTLFLWLRTFLLLPRKIIPFPLPAEAIKYGWKEIRLFKANKSNQVQSVSKQFYENFDLDNNASKGKISKINSISSKSQTVAFDSFKNCLKNPLLWTNAFHYSVIGMRLSFFFSSVLSWLRSFEDPAKISRLNDVFAFILLFGICISPLNGIIIDCIRKLLKSSTKNDKILNLKASFVSMLITSVLSIIYSVLALVPSVYGTFVSHMITRGFIHGGHAAFLASNFPFRHFGKFLGLSGLVSGIFSLIQYPLFQVSTYFDPTFYYINVGCLIACILTLIHPLAILFQIKRFNNK